MKKLKNKKSRPLFARLGLWLLHEGKLAAMSTAACKVYCALLLRADFDKHDCWPSITTIAKDAGIGRSSVYKNIKELEGLGLITKETHRGKTNRYMLNMPSATCPESDTPPVPDLNTTRPESGPKQDTSNESQTTTGVVDNEQSRKNAEAARRVARAFYELGPADRKAYSEERIVAWATGLVREYRACDIMEVLEKCRWAQHPAGIENQLRATRKTREELRQQQEKIEQEKQRRREWEKEVKRIASTPERVREILAEARERVLGLRSAGSSCVTARAGNRERLEK